MCEPTDRQIEGMARAMFLVDCPESGHLWPNIGSNDAAPNKYRAYAAAALGVEAGEPEMQDGSYRGLDAARVVAENLPSEVDGTARISEVAQRRLVLIDYLQEAAIERATLRRALAARLSTDEGE